MAITLLSHTQTQKIKTFMEKNGWSIKCLIEDNFRFSLKQNKTFILTLKFPVQLPLKFNVPFEILSFKLSIVFKFWNLDKSFIALLKKLMISLKEFSEQISLNIELPLSDKKKELLDLLNLIIPESYQNEKEQSWINKIRISLMNKRKRFETLEETMVNKIGEELGKLGLNPTFRSPWELEKGIPKLRTSETLLFSTEEPFDEFFIFEKGFYTYFKDIEYKKFYIRSLFESYTPYIIRSLFDSDDSEELLNDLLKDWVKFSRLTLNSILEIIDGIEFDPNGLRSFDPKRELETTNFVEENNNFCFSALHYESSIAKELYPLHHDLLNAPPKNFKIIENLNYLTKAEELIINYKFKEANTILTKALQTFNKYKQKKAVVTILMLLKEVALTLNQKEIAINYLKNALSIAKSGKVPLSYIIEIHFELGKAHFELEFFSVARKYFEVITDYIEKNKPTIAQKNEYLGLCYIYLGLIYQEGFDMRSKSIETFKKAFEIGKNSIKVNLNYHLLRAKYYKKGGKLSQAQKMLNMAVKNLDFEFVDTEHQELLADLYLELVEYYIFSRKSTKAANHYLSQAKRFLHEKTIEGIKRTVIWNKLMSAFFKLLINNDEKALYYHSESLKFKRQLEIILKND